MTTTKEQERKALEKIKEIVANLGENNYIATAFEGCFEIAEENIEYDFAGSMKKDLETAVKEIDSLKQLSARTDKLKTEIARLNEQLEKELEWQPYEDKDNVSQSEYEKLINSAEHVSSVTMKQRIFFTIGSDLQRKRSKSSTAFAHMK